MAIVGGVVLVSALGVAVLARPAVSTFEIQRRDRLPPPARFVTFAYEFLLNRAPDGQGLATYERMFDERGPEAVAAALAASPEFRSSQDSSTAADLSSIPARVVAAYAAGETASLAPDDTLGRIGFVGLIGALLLAIAWLRRAARQAPAPDDESRIYVPARYIVGLFAALALMAWANNDLLLASFGPTRFGYIEWLSQATALAAARGLTNVWTPYPQGAQDLILSLAAAANALATSAASDVWTSFSVFRILFQFVFLLVPSILIVALVAGLGRGISSATATLAALGAAFSIAPIYYGLLSANAMEPLPALLALVAVACLVRRRPALAGLAIGAGATLKLFPLLLLPAAIVFVESWRARLRLTLACAAVVLAVFIPPAVANLEVFLSPIRWQSGRPAWESWYAFINWAIGAPHEFRAPYFADISVGDGFGWVFWGITPRISVLVSPVPAAPPRLENLVSFAGAALVVLACFAARRRAVPALYRWGLFSLAGFLFWSPGWSPQYELYLVPFVLLAVRPPGTGLVAALLLEGLTLLEYPVLLPWAYFYGGSIVWIMWAALVGRYLLLAWLCVYVLQSEASLGALVGRLRQARGTLGARARTPRPVVVSTAALMLVAAAPGTSAAGQVPGEAYLAPRSASPERARAAAQPSCSGPLFSVPSGPVDAESTDADWPITAGHFFAQAGESPTSGFTIVDDDRARFWSEFQRLGGWRELGYPATRRFSWHGRLSQATQRAVLQWSAVTGQAEPANVLDLMHEQGLDDELLQRYQIPPPAEVSEVGLPYETIAERRLEWLDARPAIRQKYCATPGGADPLVLWGLPTSMAVNVGTAGAVYVVRTQRAAFQEWVDGAPWAAPGAVTIVLAGDLAKELELLPPDAQLPEPAPARPPPD